MLLDAALELRRERGRRLLGDLKDECAVLAEESALEQGAAAFGLLRLSDEVGRQLRTVPSVAPPNSFWGRGRGRSLGLRAAQVTAVPNALGTLSQVRATQRRLFFQIAPMMCATHFLDFAPEFYSEKHFIHFDCPCRLLEGIGPSNAAGERDDSNGTDALARNSG